MQNDHFFALRSRLNSTPACILLAFSLASRIKNAGFQTHSTKLAMNINAASRIISYTSCANRYPRHPFINSMLRYTPRATIYVTAIINDSEIRRRA